MTSATKTVDSGSQATLEDRLPGMLDDVLGRLSQVGVERILRLAAEMVEARLTASATAHVEPGRGERN